MTSETSASKASHRTNRPIGVFDSGLGGLRVLDRLMQTLPDERFVYLGDTLHMPYGDKTETQLESYVANCLDWLTGRHQVKMMVVACNTASTVTAHLFQRYPDLPFVDPVMPICRWLKDDAAYRKIGVMATPATVASNRYSNLLAALHAPVALSQVACNNLATVIEEGHGESAECEAMLRKYLAPLQAEAVEAIILGCTHYPYVMHRIADLASGIDILDPAVFMALDTKRLLAERGLAHPAKTGREIADVEYYVTAEPDRFYETSRRMPFQALAMKQPSVIDIQAKLPLTS